MVFSVSYVDSILASTTGLVEAIGRSGGLASRIKLDGFFGLEFRSVAVDPGQADPLAVLSALHDWLMQNGIEEVILGDDAGQSGKVSIVGLSLILAMLKRQATSAVQGGLLGAGFGVGFQGALEAYFQQSGVLPRTSWIGESIGPTSPSIQPREPWPTIDSILPNKPWPRE